MATKDYQRKLTKASVFRTLKKPTKAQAAKMTKKYLAAYPQVKKLAQHLHNHFRRAIVR